jgi:hypothetical protein
MAVEEGEGGEREWVQEDYREWQRKLNPRIDLDPQLNPDQDPYPQSPLTSATYPMVVL